MTSGSADRRQHPRIPVELRIDFRDLGLPNESYSDLTRDLSEGGVFVETTVGVEMGSLLELEIVPGRGQEPIRMFAEVVRVVEEQGRTGSKSTSHLRGMALKFVRLEECELDRLEALVEERSKHGGDTRARKR